MPHASLVTRSPLAAPIEPEPIEPGPFFPRRQLASEIAADLMSRPRESGLLLTGPRRSGKTTFVREDLLPVLRLEHDVHVIHIDLAAYRNAEPGLAILHALRTALQRFDGVVLRVARRLGLTNIRLGGLEMNVAQAQAVWTEGVLDLLQALSRKAAKRLVIVIDEVQRSQTTETPTHSPAAVQQLFQLLVEDRASEGQADFVASLRSLSDLDFALLRVMAETGSRFAPPHTR